MTIQKGGYIEFGKVCILCLNFKPKRQLAANSLICSGLPLTTTNINPYFRTSNGFESDMAGCRIGRGELYTNKAIASGVECIVNGAFLIIRF